MVFCNEFSTLKVRVRKHKLSRARDPVKTTTHNIRVYMVWFRPKRREGGPRRSGIGRCLVSAGRSASLIIKILVATARTKVAALLSTVYRRCPRKSVACVLRWQKEKITLTPRWRWRQFRNKFLKKKNKGHRVRRRETIGIDIARETRIVLAIV